MKKVSIRKYPSIKKNATFRALWNYYRRSQKDYLGSVKRLRETMKSYEAIKGNKSSTKKLKKAWKVELKHAMKSYDLKKAIVKDARRHVKKWLKAYHAWQEFADGRGMLNKIKPVPEKKSEKAKASKKKDQPITAKKKSAKGKAAGEKKKSTVKAKPTLKSVTKKTKPAQPKVIVTKKEASTKAKPKPAAKSPVKITAKKAAPAKKPVAKKVPTEKTVFAPTAKTGTARTRRDNLKRVEGIGVKTEQLLRKAGIDSFEKLSNSTSAALRKILTEAGPHYKSFDPTTWPKQAQFAAQGKWEELKNWQAELKGGRIVK